MGGRGSLGKRFSYNDASTIKTQLERRGIKLENVRYLNNHNLALVSTVAKQVADLKDKHGVGFRAVRLESVLDTDSYKKGKPSATSILATGVQSGTLIIRLSTHEKTLREVNQLISKSSKKGGVSPKNLREAVTHEYGHLLHNKMKLRSPKAHEKLEADLKALNNTKGKKAKVSAYAHKHMKAGNVNEAVAESMVYILNNRRSRGGQDTVKIVRSAFQTTGYLPKPKTIKTKKVTTPKPPKNTNKNRVIKEVAVTTTKVEQRGTSIPSPNKMSKADFLKKYMEAQRNKNK